MHAGGPSSPCSLHVHVPPSISLSIKAHLLGRTSARVALAAGSESGTHFIRAMESLQNSETRLCRRFWNGQLTASQLVQRASRLAGLREKLMPSQRVADRSRRLEHILQSCGGLRPRWVSNTGARAKSLQALLCPDAVTARARAALATLFWNGELDNIADFAAAFRLATAAGKNDPERAAHLQRAALEHLHAQAPAVGHGRQAALLKVFEALVAPAPTPTPPLHPEGWVAGIENPARRFSVASSSPSRVSRQDARDAWWERAMLADAGSSSESDCDSDHDCGAESDDVSCCTTSTAGWALADPSESHA